MGNEGGEEEAILNDEIEVPRQEDAEERPLPAEVRWTVGCLLATLSTIGVLILVALVAIALEPPTWVQVLLGAGLAVGGAVFAWLIASALGQRRYRS